MEDVKVITKVERSPKGLVDALFDSIDKLNGGLASSEDVRAVAHTARTIVNVARLEMDAVRLSDSIGRNIKITSLPALGLRPQEEREPAKLKNEART